MAADASHLLVASYFAPEAYIFDADTFSLLHTLPNPNLNTDFIGAEVPRIPATHAVRSSGTRSTRRLAQELVRFISTMSTREFSSKRSIARSTPQVSLAIVLPFLAIGWRWEAVSAVGGFSFSS